MAVLHCLKEDKSVVQQLAFLSFHVASQAEGEPGKDACGPPDRLAGLAQPMRPNAVDGLPALVECVLRFGVVRVQPSESVRQLRQANRGMVAYPHSHEVVDLPWRAILQAIDIDRRIQQQFRSRPEVVVDEREVRGRAPGQGSG